MPISASGPVVSAGKVGRNSGALEEIRRRRRHIIEQHQRRQEQAKAVEQRLLRLTERERTVLEHLARGRRAQSIADACGVSLATTRTQIRAVLQKLGVACQLEAVALLNEYRRMAEDG